MCKSDCQAFFACNLEFHRKNQIKQWAGQKYRSARGFNPEILQFHLPACAFSRE